MNVYRIAAKQEDPCEKTEVVPQPPKAIHKTKEQLAIEIFQYAIDVGSGVKNYFIPSNEAAKLFCSNYDFRQLPYIPIAEIKLALKDLEDPRKSYYYFVLRKLISGKYAFDKRLV